MKLFRKIVFWLHLVAGLIAGIVIGIMSFTGTALAFEKEITAFAERDARRVTPPTVDAKPLPLDELLRRIREARPDFRFTGFVISADPRDAISLSAGGRGGGGGGGGQGGAAAAPSLYANPYTGEVREASAPQTRAFLRTMNSWHRWLGVEGERRPLARAVTGASNAAFCFLAISGLYLWWPRSWSARAVRAITLFDFRARGKTRDFNWHNAIGLWSAPVLIVLTLTALPMSYRWASDAIYKLTGTPLPAEGQGGPGGGGGGGFGNGSTVEVPRPAEGAKPLGYDALVAATQKAAPNWSLITLRPSNAGGGPGGRRGGGETAGAGAGEGNRRRSNGEARPEGAPRADGTTSSAETPRAEGAPRMENREPRNNGSANAPAAAVTVTVRESDSWPRTATTTLSLDPYTGAVLRRTGYADQNGAQQVRSWTRFLHTGEALGSIGQFIAGLASLGACVLVYTGFALAWRRFFGRKAETPAAA